MNHEKVEKPRLEKVLVGRRQNDGALRRGDERVHGVVEAVVELVENDVDVFEENHGRLVELRLACGRKDGLQLSRIALAGLGLGLVVLLLPFPDVVALCGLAQVR